MTDTRRTLFGSTAWLEVVLLLGGILLAFGIEAWWADRSERLEVEEELRNVLSEFEDNRALVDQYLGWHSRAERAASALAEALQSAGTAPVMVPDSTIWGVAFTPTFDPRTGALTALISSGRFGKVPNPELRSALAGFDGFLRDARDEEIRARDYTDSQVLPALIQSGNVGRALFCTTCRDSGFPTDRTARLQNSAELQALVARRALFADLSIESLQGVRGQIDRITELIRSTLSS